MHARRTVSCWLPLLVVVVSGARCETVDEFTRKAVAEIEQADPRAARLFEQANAAREARDLETASRRYGEVLALLPSCDHAMRRRAGVEAALGHEEAAIDLARGAVAVRRTAVNLMTLAEVLIDDAEESASGARMRAEARRLALEALQVDPTQARPHLALARIALDRNDLVDARAAIDAARALDPADASALYVSALVHGRGGDLRRARADLEDARAHGLAEDVYRDYSAAIDAATPWWSRARRVIVIVAAAWVGGFVLLLVAGMVLSATAMRAAGRSPNGAQVHRMPAGIRRAYTAVLWLAGAFYYASLPLVLVMVLGLGGGALAGLFYVGWVPLKLAAILAGVVLVTAWAVLRSLFIRPRDEDPGERLDLSQHARLREVLHDVAARIGTPPVDDVFLSPGTSVAVFERGGLLARARGTSRRCLVLGAGVLDGMKLSAFRAILGHEYGHLINRDCAGGALALLVRRHLGGMAMGLAEEGAATWYNPAWWFVNLYSRVFLRISHGASRLQEVMADRWAVSAYGSRAFIDGLTHVIRRGLQLDGQVQAAIQVSSMTNAVVANVYTFAGGGAPSPQDIERGLRQRVELAGSPYDSHPRIADRLRFAEAMAVPDPPDPHSDEEAWSLFDDRAAVEKRMSAAILSAAW